MNTRFCYARAFASMLMLAALSACTSLSKPFYGPGDEGKRLIANVPTPRLAVPPPKALFRDPKVALNFAQTMTQSMVAQSLPAVTKVKSKGDWWLDIGQEPSAIGLTPRFTVIAPDGKIKGHVNGAGRAGLSWPDLTSEQRRQIALDAAPRIASLLTGIQADAMMADPNSLKRRPARVYFSGVKNAPGDGNLALSRVFISLLPDRFNQLAKNASDADFVVSGEVHLSDQPKGMTGHPAQAIEIIWRVQDRVGKEAGAATQLHDVPAGSLDHAWGDVALAAAQEAAGAVRQIITAYSGRNFKPLPSNER